MYRKFFHKAHLILGLSTGLILMIIGTTGAVLSFEQEIMKYMNKDSYTVSVSNKSKIPIKEILEEFKVKKPNAEIIAITFSNMNSSLVIKTAKKEKYFINPYTSEFLAQEKGETFFRTVKSLHRTLLLKDFGKNIVGITAISLLILMLSGVYIYFPRLKKRFLESFTFSFKSKGKYFLSSIHSALGMWLIPFYLFAVLTGLNWSYTWYSSTFYKIMGVEKPQRLAVKSIKEKNDYAFDEVTKAIEVFDSIVTNKYQYSLVKLPKQGTVYNFLYMDENANHRRERNKLVLDIEIKQVLNHERFEDKPLKEQIMISMLTLHTGEYFGTLGQIVMFIVSLLLPLFGISGLLLYINKKKKRDNKIFTSK